MLISAMNQNDDSLVKKMNVRKDCLIINQITEVNDIAVTSNSNQVRILNYHEKGLSKSRNKAIKNAKGDICIIADDDVIYEADYEEKIIQAYIENPDADIIAFQVPRTGKLHSKKYSNKKSRGNYLTCLKVSSVEITFKRQSILENNILFNENFGSGSGKFSMGEENIFLYNCLKKGLKILYIPVKIGETENIESSWFRGFNRKYFIDRGASFYAMSRNFYLILIIQFAVRKRRVYKENFKLIQALQIMLEGANMYKKMSKE